MIWIPWPSIPFKWGNNVLMFSFVRNDFIPSNANLCCRRLASIELLTVVSLFIA